MKVVVEDKNRIKEVVFKYPHLMSGSAANDIKGIPSDSLNAMDFIEEVRVFPSQLIKVKVIWQWK